MASDKPTTPGGGGTGLFNLSIGSRKTSRSPSETIAHPLLGASTSSLASEPDDMLGLSSGTAGTSPAASGALPYKPRQRATAGGARTVTDPTPTATSPSLSATGTGIAAAPTTSLATSTTFALTPTAETGALDATATSRLQLQSLKAVAQRIGLGNASMGIGMIDSIFDKGARARTEGGDWGELLKVLTTGKAIILLPSTPASSLPMTPQTLRDHVAFLSPPICPTGGTSTPSEHAAVLVTLSGLIGTLRGTTIVFESSIPADAPLISALRDDSQRVAVLARLRPTQPASAESSFPSYTISSESAPLPFPALGKAVPVGMTEKSPAKEAPRRINPFASLFGTPSSSTPLAGSPSLAATRSLSPEPTPTAGSSVLSSPRPSIASLETETPDAGEGYTVSAYTINKPVRYNEVHKALVKAVRSDVRADLTGLPDKVIEKTLRLVVGSVCPVSGNAADQALLKSHHHGLGSTEGNATVPLDFSDPTTTGERLQDFMEAIYDDLVVYYRTTESPRKPWSRSGSVDPAEDDDDATRVEKKELNVELAASEGTEKVEGLVSRLLYNRIFSPLQSDDGRHDEALASRIAALNLLDLSLDHLGLITRPPAEKIKGSLAKGLAKLVGEIGLELQRLSAPDCLTPREKTEVLVRAHKIAVEGLDHLPSIKLRPEGEPYVPPPAEDEQELSPIGEGVEEESDQNGQDDKASSSPTSGADLILPIMIYAVVKANPPQLASQLMYLRRYRSAICLVGEASYAIVNLTAVVEFLEHVQLSELGLGDSDKVMSVEDLTPIGLPYLDDGNEDNASIASASSRLRGRVFQVSELAGSAAGSANKVITGVVDSSWSALRGMISSTPQVTATPPNDEPDSPASTNFPRPATRPRQASTFSLASVTASVANIAAAASTAAARTRSRANSHAEWPNQEMVDVATHPDSLQELEERDIYEAEEGSDDSEHREDGVGTRNRSRSDARSIVSVSSMMTHPREGKRERERSRERPMTGDKESIGGRLAQIGGFRIGTPEPPEKASFFSSFRSSAPNKSRSTKGPMPEDGPMERFMNCEVDDMRLSDVGVLLRDYRRLAGIVARMQEKEKEK